jgi:peroxiredoxin
MAAGVNCSAPFRGIALAALLCAATARGDSLTHLSVGSRAPFFSAPGADGKLHRLSDYAGHIVVLEWTSPACPFTAVKYTNGTMQALQRFAAERHAVWLSIDTAAPGRQGYLTATAARSRITATHAAISGFLFDHSGVIARSFGAKTTPSFFIIGRDGRLVYEGAMDDENSTAGTDVKQYVRDALDEVAAGRPVATPETAQFGCAIEY